MDRKIISPRSAIGITIVLRNNTDLFSWKPEDMIGIGLGVAVHKLNIKTDVKLVKPMHRHFRAQQNKVIE